MPTESTITLLFVSRCVLLPYSFVGYLGHCSSCIVLLCMTFHTNNQVSNTKELHLLMSKESMYNMYIICIPELDISSLFLFYQIFCRSYLAFPLH
jgi:hypothetical protein